MDCEGCYFDSGLCSENYGFMFGVSMSGLMSEPEKLMLPQGEWSMEKHPAFEETSFTIRKV